MLQLVEGRNEGAFCTPKMQPVSSGVGVEHTRTVRHSEDHRMERTTTYEYIARREEVLGGEPIIEGTRTPVRAIVKEWRLGTPPEEIPDGLPHLTLAQVFAALAYYSDHKEEINSLIEGNRIPADMRGTGISREKRSRSGREGTS